MKKFIFTIVTVLNINVFAQSFEPGVWTFKSKIRVGKISLPESSSEECITPERAKDARGTIEKELQKQGCKIISWSVKNEKLDASLSCENDALTATGKLSGPFSKKTYYLEGDAKGKIKKKIPAKAHLSLTGAWIKFCEIL